jgi:predicted PurR-regulated permease PerM
VSTPPDEPAGPELDQEPEPEPETEADARSHWPQVERRRLVGGTFWAWLRQTARLWGFLAFILLILVVFRQVILPFVLALLVAYVLAPLVRWLRARTFAGRSVPRFVWVIAIYVALLGLMSLFFTTFVPRLTGDFKRIVKETPVLAKKVREHYVPTVAAWIEVNLGVDLQPEAPAPTAPVAAPRVRLRQAEEGALELELSDVRVEVTHDDQGRWTLKVPGPGSAKPEAKTFASSLDHYLAGFVTRSESQIKRMMAAGQKLLLVVLNTITTFILVLMISAFLLLDTERILRWFRNLVPQGYHDDFDNVVCLIDKGLSGAIRGQAIICLINAALTWIGLVLIGVKYPLLLALLAGVMSLIPIFGSILSSIPIVLVALASGSAGVDVLKGVLILLWIIAIHLVEANLLNPKIMGTAARIHPVVVIFAVVAGERFYGPIGALLGVPLVSAVQALFVYLRRKVRGELDKEQVDPQCNQPAPTQSG